MNVYQGDGGDYSDVDNQQRSSTPTADANKEMQDEINKKLVDRKYQEMFNPEGQQSHYDATTNADSVNNPNYIISDYGSQNDSSLRNSQTDDNNDAGSDDGIAEDLDANLRVPDQGRRYEGANFHKQHWKYWTFKRMQCYRVTIFILQTPMVIIPGLMNGPLMMFEYATQWAIELCLLTHLCGYIAARRPDSYRWRAATCIIQQVAMCFNFTTCFVFWAAVAPVFLPLVPWWYRIGLILGHVTPLIFVIWHYYLNDNIMYPGDWWHTGVTGFVYCWLNWIFTVTGDELVYPFLPWDSFMSVFWCTFCTFVGIVMWWIIIMLTNKRRKRPICAGRDDYHTQTRASFHQQQSSDMEEANNMLAQFQDNQANSYEAVEDI